MEVLFLFILLIFYTAVRILTGVFFDETAREMRKYKTGLQLIHRRQYEEAVLYFDAHLHKNARNAIAYAYRGKCQLALGNYAAAIHDCTKASAFSRVLPEAFLDKGVALYKLEMFAEALLELDKAVWHFKENPEAYRWRGMTRTRLDMPEKAESDFRKAAALGDEHAGYYLIRKGKLEI
jgi:tetratricopeptide (TPR) repeat protein